jgi:hypothetical protein
VKSRLISFLLCVLGPCLACASAPANREATCELVPADSQYLVGGPVYHDCAVDQRARLRGRAVYPDNFEPQLPLTEPGERCYRVDLQFVVDTSGAPELGTAQVVRTNHPECAEAVMATLPKWRFRPALRGGVPVRQIVREKQEMAVQVVTVVAGDVPRLGRPPRC